MKYLVLFSTVLALALPAQAENKTKGDATKKPVSRESAFKKLDKNHDGKITSEEFSGKPDHKASTCKKSCAEKPKKTKVTHAAANGKKAKKSHDVSKGRKAKKGHQAHKGHKGKKSHKAHGSHKGKKAHKGHRNHKGKKSHKA